MTGSFSNVSAVGEVNSSPTVKEVERIVGAVADTSYIEDKLDLLITALRDVKPVVNVAPPENIVHVPDSPITVTPNINIDIPEIRIPQPTVVVKQDKFLTATILLMVLADIVIKVIFR